MEENQTQSTVEEHEKSGITLDKLKDYFHLPIQTVASELGICVTKLKKLCRAFGIARWPQRKVLSLNNMIDQLQSELASGRVDDVAKERTLQRLNIVMAKKKMLYDDPNIEMTITPSTIFIMPDDIPSPMKRCCDKDYDYDYQESKRPRKDIDDPQSTSPMVCSRSSETTPPTTESHHRNLPSLSVLAPILTARRKMNRADRSKLEYENAKQQESGMDFDAFCATMPDDLTMLPPLTAYFNISPETLSKCRQTRIPLYFTNVPLLEKKTNQ